MTSRLSLVYHFKSLGILYVRLGFSAVRTVFDSLYSPRIRMDRARTSIFNSDQAFVRMTNSLLRSIIHAMRVLKPMILWYSCLLVLQLKAKPGSTIFDKTRIAVGCFLVGCAFVNYAIENLRMVLISA